MTVLATKEKITDIGLNYVYEYFESWLSTRSKNTAKNYKSDVELFCKVVLDKEIKFVTVEDLESLKTIHAHRFFTYMKYEQQAKNATIKRRFNAVRSFLKTLKKDFKNINPDLMQMDLPSEKIDRNGWGNLTWDEAKQIWEYALEHQIEGLEMGLLVKLACVTSIRIEALLELTWEDNFFQKNEKGTIVNYIDTYDKGQRVKAPISDKMYEELKQLGDSGKLFKNLYAQKARNYLQDIVKALDIDERRNISFHSLKKVGVNQVLKKTGNIYLAKIQGKHKSIATTESYYIELQDDLTQYPSYTLDEEIDFKNELEKYSKEELIKAINELSDMAKFELLRKLNNL
jgi:integrase